VEEDKENLGKKKEKWGGRREGKLYLFTDYE